MRREGIWPLVDLLPKKLAPIGGRRGKKKIALGAPHQGGAMAQRRRQRAGRDGKRIEPQLYEARPKRDARRNMGSAAAEVQL